MVIRNQPLARVLMDLWLVIFAALVVVYVAMNGPLLTIAGNLAPILFALAFVLSYAGFGAPLVRRFLGNLDAVDQLLLSIAFGMGLTGVLVFGLGLIGVLEPWVYAAWSLIGLLLFAVHAARTVPPVFRRIDLSDPLTVLAVAILTVFVLQLVPFLVAPPSSTDALEYHLLIPKLYLQLDRIANIPLLVEASYPSLAEYLYLPVLTIAGDVACKCLHFWIGLAAVVALGRLVARASPQGNKLLAPALFASMPLVIVCFGLAWNDGIFVFFLLLCLGQLLDYHGAETMGGSPMVVAGVAAGLAAWTKYTVVMLLLALVPVFLIGLFRWRWRPSHIAAFALPVGLISLLVFVKNWAFTGNPFFPFLSSFFPSPHWNAAAAEHFSHAVRHWEIAEWDWRAYLLFPFRITLVPRLADIHTGVVPLLLVPFLFVKSATRELGLLKLLIASHVVVWLFLHTENRSLLTLLAVILVVGTAGLTRTVEQWPVFRRPLIVLLVLATLCNLGMTVVNTFYLTSPMAFFIGRESRSQFLLREAETQAAYEWLNRSGEVDRVLLVGPRGPYHLNRAAFFSSFSDQPMVEALTRGATSPEEIRDRLLTIGISHVVVDFDLYRNDHEVGLYSWSDSERIDFEQFIRRLCDEVADFGRETVFRIRDGAPSKSVDP